MALCRPVPTDYWTDPKINEEYTLDDKLLYIYLITNDRFQQLGIYRITKKMVSVELNMDMERVEKAFDDLENKFKVIKYSKETNEVAILNYFNYGIIKGGKPLESCFENLGKKVNDFTLLKELYTYSKKNIIDDRSSYSNVMDKIKNQLKVVGMMDEEINHNEQNDNVSYEYYDEEPF